MIDLYYWPTPNGHKITIFLEEADQHYTIHPVNIGQGDQFKESFLKINPNNKMPAIVDHAPLDKGGDFTLFESGAILWYLAEKTQKFIPENKRDKAIVSEWLFWQMAGFGPMLGQNHHFNQFAKEKIPYAIERYTKETARLYGVLDKQLSKNEYVAGIDYTIADMAIYPWVVPHEMQKQDLNNFPNIKRWFDKISKRPAVKRAYEIGEEYSKK